MFHIWSLGSASSVPVLGGVLLFIFIIAHIISFNPCHKLEEVGIFSPIFKMKKQGFRALTSTAVPLLLLSKGSSLVEKLVPYGR